MTAVFPPPRANSSKVAERCTVAAETPRTVTATHVAHDARNWLTVLQVYCDLLRHRGASWHQRRAWIEELSQAVERGHGLVLSLLASAQTAPATEPCHAAAEIAGSKTLDLAAAIQSRQPLFQRMAGSQIRVDCKTPLRAATAALHETEFDRILWNLVRNGIDAMPQGGELRIELEAAAVSHPHSLRMRITDTGSGIPADVLPRVFDSGFSTKGAQRNSPASRGYGLAIVRELTAAAGGSVDAVSRIGHGTCFTVELPAQSPVAPDAPSKCLIASRKRPTHTPARTRRGNNIDAHRKGTRVPC